MGARAAGRGSCGPALLPRLAAKRRGAGHARTGAAYARADGRRARCLTASLLRVRGRRLRALPACTRKGGATAGAHEDARHLATGQASSLIRAGIATGWSFSGARDSGQDETVVASSLPWQASLRPVVARVSRATARRRQD